MTKPTVDRRGVLTGATLIAMAASAGAAAETPPPPATAATTPAGVAFAPKPAPMPFDPKAVAGLSEKLLTSHYANNYTGAVKRLGAITAQFASLDPATAPG
ncbi:MAG TPA: superoxide dismutase, partial [Caulobacteraceae bacterium]